MSANGTRPRLSVIGAGKIGQAVGKLWLVAGYEVVFGDRSPDKLAPILARYERASVRSPRDAALAGEIVFISVPGEAVDELLAQIGDALAGKIVIDAANTLAFDAGRWVSALEPGLTEGRRMQRLLPDSLVTRAFSHVPDELLFPRGTEQRLYWAVAVAGDDPQATATVADLVHDAGWVPVIVGDLDGSAALDAGGAVFHQFFTEVEMRELVGAPAVPAV